MENLLPVLFIHGINDSCNGNLALKEFGDMIQNFTYDERYDNYTESKCIDIGQYFLFGGAPIYSWLTSFKS